MVVQHNLTAMNSNRMLGLTTSAQAKSTEKLSSGYKINRAADDAAGLAISEKMRSQVRGLTQASANAQDGISAVQTAEGALTEVHDMPQRMNELATKSANGTNSQEERDYIQSEVNALIDEIDRVSETTKFNEIYLLKGPQDSNGTAEATSAVKKQTVTLKPETIEGMNGRLKVKQDAYAKGETDAVTADTGATAAEAAKMEFAGTNFIVTTANGAASGADGSAQNITDTAGLADYFNVTDDGTVSLNTTKYPDIKVWGTGGQIATEITDLTTIVTGTPAKAAGDAAEGSLSQYVEIKDGVIQYKEGAVLYKAAADETTPYGNQTTDNEIAPDELTDYFEIEGQGIYTDAAMTKPLSATDDMSKYFDEYGVLKDGVALFTKADPADTTATEIGAEQLNKFFDFKDAAGAGEALEFTLQVGAEGNEENTITVTIKPMSAAGIGIDGLRCEKEDQKTQKTGVHTQEASQKAIDTIKDAIKVVSQQRSDLGAVQNRLEHTINNLDNVVENTAAAESAIRDTDMAEEMVRYSNNSILQQAGQSMLAQANQSNQGVLSLLG